MRAIVVGAVESTRIALRTLADAPGWQVAGLVTLPLDLAHRHSDFVDLAGEAQAVGCPVIYARNSNAAAVCDKVRALAPDIGIVIGWSQICGPGFADAAGGRLLGYHPAPLPRLRGRGVIPWTILAAEPITASTLFVIDAGVDSGPVVAQRFFHVAPRETAATLYDRHMAVLAAMLAETLPDLARGNLEGEPQDDRFVTWAAKREPDDGRISWAAPAEAVDRLVRAVGRPYPGAFTTMAGERLVIWRAEPEPRVSRHLAAPGQVVAIDGPEFLVRCGDTCDLRVLEWENASGRQPKLHARLGERQAP